MLLLHSYCFYYVCGTNWPPQYWIWLLSILLNPCSWQILSFLSLPLLWAILSHVIKPLYICTGHLSPQLLQTHPLLMCPTLHHVPSSLVCINGCKWNNLLLHHSDCVTLALCCCPLSFHIRFKHKTLHDSAPPTILLLFPPFSLLSTVLPIWKTEHPFVSFPHPHLHAFFLSFIHWEPNIYPLFIQIHPLGLIHNCIQLE